MHSINISRTTVQLQCTYVQLKRYSNFNNMVDSKGLLFLYRVSKKTDTFVIQIGRESISFFTHPVHPVVAFWRMVVF